MASECRWCHQPNDHHQQGCPKGKVVPFKHPGYRLVKITKGDKTWFRIDQWSGADPPEDWSALQEFADEENARAHFKFLCAPLKEEVLEVGG